MLSFVIYSRAGLACSPVIFVYIFTDQQKPPCSFFPTGFSPLQFAGFFRREARMAVKSAYQALAAGPRRPALSAS